MKSVFTGPVFVVGDNTDTGQIIPAQYLTLVPTILEEYEKLGAYAFAGLPESLYPVPFVKEGQLDTEHPIVVGGRDFGCGSSREHAPIALGSAGCRSVVGQRCKLSGMHWSVAGVDNVLDLRCLLASGRLWDQFWKNRQEQQRGRLASAA